MKIFKSIQIFGVLALALFLGSCNNDDDGVRPIIPGAPVGVDVKFQVTASADVITEIAYRMGDGNLFYGSFEENPTEWEKVTASLFRNMPEEAYLRVKCLNRTEAVQNCTLRIFRGEELIETLTRPVAIADDKPETDDTVVISVSKLIHE